MTASASDYEKGFNRGFIQLRQSDTSSATKKLWEALGINNRNSWRMYRNGSRQCSAVQAVKVETVFAEYRIKEIWGD